MSKFKDASLLKKLPSYKNPPVNEVVCGMRIRPADKLLIPHIGLLWDKFRADYPMLQHARTIATTKGEIVVDKVTNLPIPRVWFINASDDQLVQFQNDRFYFNWRKRKSDYPRYDHVISNFETVLNAVKDLFNDFDLGGPEPIEYELTYINHIPQGIGWKTIDDLTEIFSDFIWNKTTARFLPNPEEISWVTKFSFPEQKSHLIISLKQAIRTEDEVPVLIFELKANGIDRDNNVRNWFDLAHEWIVRGFTDLTTEKMHKIWGIEENA
ncbi:TIGR04255 family protein [candidate division KSB1 bacterium]|nr:TIGR04255 family protein [candidate division KSB1 bacterium]